MPTEKRTNPEVYGSMNSYSKHILLINTQRKKQDIKSAQTPSLVSPSSCYSPYPRVTTILVSNTTDSFCL